MKLNIETVKKVAEVAELIGEGSHIQINSHFYKSYEEAQKDALMVSEALGYGITEGNRNGTGWFQLRDKPYGNTVEISLYYSYESKVTI